MPQGRYLDVFQGLMDEPSLSLQSAAEIFKTKGVDLARVDTPAARAAATAHLLKNRALAKAIGVEGTPVFIVGDKRIDGWSPEALEAALAAPSAAGGEAKSRS
jgi:protein-disulfide isomerase